MYMILRKHHITEYIYYRFGQTVVIFDPWRQHQCSV